MSHDLIDKEKSFFSKVISYVENGVLEMIIQLLLTRFLFYF